MCTRLYAWSTESIPYLGVYITPTIDQLNKANYPSLYKKIGEDMDSWSRHDLSWIGRRHSIKMTFLPCLLYLFWSFPIPLKRDQLNSFHSKIICFIWGNKGYRRPKSILFRLRTQGGLALSNLWQYFQVAQLAQISRVYSWGSEPDWINMKRQVVPHHTLDYVVRNSLKLRPPILAPTLFHSLTLCDKAHKFSTLVSDLRTLSHLSTIPTRSKH